VSATMSLTIRTARDELDRINAAVDSLAEQDDWPADLVFRVRLVLEEWNLNVMDHGHDDDTHEIDIELTSDTDEVTIEIVDGGKPFDPLHDAPAPDLTSAVGERRVGGLGVHFMRELMDEVLYKRESGKNHLKLVTRKVR